MAPPSPTLPEVGSSDAFSGFAANTTGNLNSMFWGILIATVLLGVSIIQGYAYFKNYDDKRPLKLLVATVITLDLVSTGLSFHLLHSYVLSSYGTTNSVNSAPPPTFGAEFLVTQTIILLSQLFYASQIYKLNRHSVRRLLPCAVMVTLSFSAFLSNIIGTFILTNMLYFGGAINLDLIEILTSIANCCGAISDLIACCALSFFLASHRSDLGRGHTTLVDKLLLYTINRGILFTLAQLGRMIAYIAAPNALYWLPFHYPLSKLHVNSLLMLLNSRKALRGAAQDVSRIDFRVDPPAIGARPSQTHQPLSPRPIELHRLRNDLGTRNDNKVNPSSNEHSDHSDHSSTLVGKIKRSFIGDEDAP